MENTFLNQEKFNRLVYSESVDEAMRGLQESNYGGGTIAAKGAWEKNLCAAEDKGTGLRAASRPVGCGLGRLS